jgi:hypothetical protein
MADTLFANTKASTKKSVLNSISYGSTASDQPLRVEVANHINKLYDNAGLNSSIANRSTHSKLFELLKRHKKSISKQKANEIET